MTSGTPTTTPATTPAAPPAGRLADGTGQGRTTIAASVVQKIAGIAAREVSGVYSMGSGASRAFGALRERIPGGGTSGASTVAGVSVEVGEKQAAVDLDVVVEYGVAIADLASRLVDRRGSRVEVTWTRGLTPSLPYPTRTALLPVRP